MGVIIPAPCFLFTANWGQCNSVYGYVPTSNVLILTLLVEVAVCYNVDVAFLYMTIQ